MMPQGQGGGYGPLGMLFTPWVKRLMIATGVLSVVGAVLIRWMGVQAPLAFVLQPAAVWGHGSMLPGIPALWQPFTYLFFVFDPLGLIFALALYGWFAGSMEAWWGSRRFLRFVLMVGVGSAALTVLVALAWPNLAGTLVMGPYPLIEGLVIAWGLTFKNQEVRLYFILPVKGIHLVWLTVGIVAVQIIFSGSVAPFVPQLIGMGIAASLVTGLWRFDRARLHLRKWWVETQLKNERSRRKRRVKNEASHLRVVDEDDDEAGRGKGPSGNGTSGDGTHGGGWLN